MRFEGLQGSLWCLCRHAESVVVVDDHRPGRLRGGVQAL